MGESSPINKSLAGNVEKKNSTEDSMLLDAVLGDLKKEFSSTTNPKTSTPQQPIKQTSTPLATTKSLIERLQEAHKLYAQHNKTDRDDRIIGIDALTSYVKWTRLAQKTLQQNPTKEELEQISAHLPQRLTQKKRIPTLDPKKTKTG
ncbi:MAG: hypothetical protein KAS07_05730, partial [Candidatus Pacebacteria bacterium]|nr:hypothetical protein [Candidatus Paceibacterota bacterium]